KENFANAETAAAGAAVSESAAKARVAVAIGARQDAEKRASEARERVIELEGVLAAERQASARRLEEMEKACEELRFRVNAAGGEMEDERARQKAELEDVLRQKDDMVRFT
ncbi:unnamed protein product, partial [Sphacelaria rigidula]